MELEAKPIREFAVRWTRAVSGAVLIAALFCSTPYAQAPAATQAPTPSAANAAVAAERAYATRITVPGVKGFAQVTPNLFRGEQPSEAGFQNLAKMGINIDVDLRLSRKESESKRVTALGMRYVSIPWFCMRPRDEAFATFLQLVRDNPDKKIFVHCRTGDDRVGMNIAAYRMANQGWTAEQAGKEMRALGADWWHRRICLGLGKYESQFPERYRTQSAFAQLREAKSTSSASSLGSSPTNRSQ